MSQPVQLTATELQQKSGQIIKRCYVGREHFIITRDGFPMIAIIPIDEYHQLMSSHPPQKQDSAA